METAEQQLLITQEQIIAPVIEILKEVTPTKPVKVQEVPQYITQSLNVLFPEQQYDEKRIQKAKEILGDLAYEFTDEQLQDVVAEIQYLTESWLDDFERKIFKGLTLKELLHDKGGL